MALEKLAVNLRQHGYVILRQWRPDDATLTVGHTVGSVVDVSTLALSGHVPTVQTLVPTSRHKAHNTVYSGIFGLGEFPLHTDLAHWMVPPRYMMLRCQRGSQAVATRLLAASEIVTRVGSDTVRQALTRQRRVAPGRIFCVLPLIFSVGAITAFRWDPVFLLPVNEAALHVRNVMGDLAKCCSKMSSVVLAELGDTLLVDNWKVLHGRSHVPNGSTDRHLERIYLSEVYQ